MFKWNKKKKFLITISHESNAEKHWSQKTEEQDWIGPLATLLWYYLPKPFKV